MVTHMNEGHSAFLALERIREVMVERSFSFAEAIQAVWPTNIFTTHTPVPAGNERFGLDLMEKYFRAWAQQLGVEWQEFLALGRERPEDHSESFCVTIFALKLSAFANGVGQAPRRSVAEDVGGALAVTCPSTKCRSPRSRMAYIPRTWVSHNMLELLDRYFGPRFYEEPANLDMWDRLDRISDEELWRTHERRRERLVVFARDRLKRAMKRAGAAEGALHRAEDVLSPYAITISFARRFATTSAATSSCAIPSASCASFPTRKGPYRSSSRARRIPTISRQGDNQGARALFASEEVQSRIIFLEDYDMTMARYLRRDRRLAQHPAPAPRGFGHERDEGRHKRRPQLLHPRRLVGGRLRTRSRLGHRFGRGIPGRGAAGSNRERGPPTTFSSTKSSRCLTRGAATACRENGSSG